ncbi:DNA-binding response regulator, partial [Clostridium cochlearium]|nr:DNA-binding response regulator [Clostridium cochlearium]
MCKMKVLIIDDEEYIVELIKFNLERNGYEVIYGYDGREAIKLAEEGKTPMYIAI